jgi:copper chaperone CopZ
MFRRQFMQFMATISASSVATIAAADAEGLKTVSFSVKGFSCVTCAVGLDTTLGKLKGVISSKSTYPEGIARIQFDPRETTENALKAAIEEIGFTVAEGKSA